MRIYLTGQLSIEHAGGVVREDRFPGVQGRVLFALLSGENRRSVSREEIEAELWPGDPPPAAGGAVRALVSKLRGVIGEAGMSPDSLAHAFGAYRLNLSEDAWVDVPAAFEAIHRAEPAVRDGDLQGAIGWGRAAATIADRPFLPGADGPWATATRARLRDTRIRALETLALAWIAHGDPRQATRDAAAAVAMDPYRETAYRLWLRALAADGNRAEALRIYADLQARLSDELGVDPSPETESVYLEILRSA
jgi:DNA-binding SARP family transcriptional activator